MNAKYLAEQFNTALAYDRYLATGTPEQQRRWRQVYDAAQLAGTQRQLIESFTRPMKLLVISGIWCGDCVQQCPLLQRIAEANPRCIELRLVDRDVHKELSSRCRINGGDRVPVVLFLAEDFELCAVYGDRTLWRYRLLAAKQLAMACPLPVAAPAADELAATMHDWLNEVERIELMLRLSSRLRQRYND
jgi:thiol-disulfide isomerase/thioredoxin